MAIYEDDQQQGTALVVNGVHVNASPAVAASTLPATTAYKFTVSYSFGGVHYRRGVTYSLTPALKAALLAVSAPMVSVN